MHGRIVSGAGSGNPYRTLMNQPFLLFSDEAGTIYSHPVLRMAHGASEGGYCLPRADDIAALPSGSTLFYLPGRYPVGYDPRGKRFEILREYRGRRVHAVAAFLVPAYLRLAHPAFARERTKKKRYLPLWAYTACGAYGGRMYAAAMRIDSRVRQSPRFYDNALITRKVRKFLKAYPQNRLYAHLAHCALNYNCLAAKNLFMERWEAPLPVSNICNARCVGCLSFQEKQCESSHQRISFTPSPDEICEVAVHHLKTARHALVSFGQGCEGEPLMRSGVIEKAIRKIRGVTGRGTIHINTNASRPASVEALCRAGIDSFRVSMNSCRTLSYRRYFKPRGYTFDDVLSSVNIARKYGKFVAVNLLVFPGFTDQKQEVESFFSFLRKTDVDMVQFRNLNIDPVLYRNRCRISSGNTLGVKSLVRLTRRTFRKLKIGYFNLPKERFRDF